MHFLWTAAIMLGAAALMGIHLWDMPEAAVKAVAAEMAFTDARSQAATFIAKYNSVSLTPEQRRTREAALSSIPAPCCKDYSIETCCCPCNLAKSVWGLAGMLIAERGYDASKVKAAVEEWIQFTNTNGYTGTACYQGRCGKPFSQDGCGGMDERSIS